MVIAQQSSSGSCVLTCVPPSCQVVSTGEIGTQPLSLVASDTGYTYVYTSSQIAWWRTVSLGTYWYCCGGVLVYTYSSTVLLTRFARINFINSLFRCFVPYTGYTYVYTSSQLAWWRTVSLGTYWYCCGGVLGYTYSTTVLLTRFARINFINSLFRCCK